MIKNAPKRIYLQVGDIPTDDIDFKDLHEVSWCEDKINDNDLCYIRAGKCYTPAVSKCVEPVEEGTLIDFFSWLKLKGYLRSNVFAKDIIDLYKSINGC